MSFIEVKQKKKQTRYGLKFSVLPMIIKRMKTFKGMSFVEVKQKKKKKCWKRKIKYLVNNSLLLNRRNMV